MILPKRIVRTFLSGAFVLGLAVGAGCGGDDGDTGETPDAGGSDFVCDDEGANPAMGALLNEPVAADVEVVVKQPQHPGDPGPTNLP